MHGMIQSMVQGKARKRLNIERTAQIKKATGVFLTLHGGSGTDDEDFRNSIAAGINIVHTNMNCGSLEAVSRSLAKRDTGHAVRVTCEKGPPDVAGSHVLLAVGRVPNTSDLGLDKTGVARNRGLSNRPNCIGQPLASVRLATLRRSNQGKKLLAILYVPTDEPPQKTG